MAGPGVFVDVAANRGERRERGKLVKDFGRADVTGVNDVGGTAQSGEGIGTKQAVSVGDDADVGRSSQSGSWRLAVG